MQTSLPPKELVFSAIFPKMVQTEEQLLQQKVGLIGTIDSEFDPEAECYHMQTLSAAKILAGAASEVANTQDVLQQAMSVHHETVEMGSMVCVKKDDRYLNLIIVPEDAGERHEIGDHVYHFATPESQLVQSIYGQRVGFSTDIFCNGKNSHIEIIAVQ